MRKPFSIHLMMAAFLFGLFAWIGLPQPSSAQVGTARDGISDRWSDLPGALKDSEQDSRPDRGKDFNPVDATGREGTPDRRPARDSTPDRVGGKDCLLADIAVGECDRRTSHDATPDCTNGPGDGRCGNSPSQGDLTPDDLNFPPALTGGSPGNPGFTKPNDGNSDGTPERRNPAVNKWGDNTTDLTPDRPNRDVTISIQGGVLTINDRVGARDCVPADLLEGECDRDESGGPSDGKNDRAGTAGDSTVDDPRSPAKDASPDGVAESTTPRFGMTREKDGDGAGSQGDGAGQSENDGVRDRVYAANQDRKHDGNPSRGVRDVGTSRDAFGSGPSDKRADGFSDRGGSAASGGGGSSSSGCSFATSHTANPFAAGLFLLIVLAPMALIRLRRSMKK